MSQALEILDHLIETGSKPGSNQWLCMAVGQLKKVRTDVRKTEAELEAMKKAEPTLWQGATP